jgi:hypothetical protein
MISTAQLGDERPLAEDKGGIAKQGGGTGTMTVGHHGNTLHNAMCSYLNERLHSDMFLQGIAKLVARTCFPSWAIPADFADRHLHKIQTRTRVVHLRKRMNVFRS